MTSVHESRAIADLAGGPIEYTLRRTPRARGIRIVVDDRRGVVVSMPLATRRGWARPHGQVDRFLIEHEPWLRRQLDNHARLRGELAARGGIADGSTFLFRGEMHRLRIVDADGRLSGVSRVGGEAGDEIVVELTTRDADRVAVVLGGWLKDRARVAVGREIERHGEALGVRPSSVAVRDPRSRWGSATRDGRLMFSWRLILAPSAALETVVVHELAHLRVFGHGSRFWALVASRCPDHVAWRRWLRRHSFELHHALDEPPPST